MRTLFDLGQLVTTQRAMEFCKRHDIDPLALIVRHVQGDFGDLCAEDVKANLQAIVTGARILSSYRFGEEKVWLITEADRASTCILLPDEY